MFEKEKELGITDLINMDFLQGFQDLFAKAMNLASKTIDHSGPITETRIINDFCAKYTRSTPEGYKRCLKCEAEWGSKVAENGEPLIFTCHAGLKIFAVPIMAGGKNYATFLVGQVLFEPPNEDDFRKIAREIGVNEDEYIQALRKIEIVSADKLEAIAQMVHLGANSLSNMAHNHLKLLERNKIDTIYREIIGAIRNSLDIDETKRQIVNIVGKTLNADRCFITDFDKTSNKYLIVKDEYLSSDKILPFKGVDVNIEIPNFAEAVKQGKTLLINNKEIFLQTENQDFDVEKKVIEKYGVTSVFAFPLFYFEDFLGVLAIHYVDKPHIITSDEIDLITMIAAQVAIALHQAKLYALLNQKLEDEKVILNNMPFMAWIKDIDSKYAAVNEQFCRNYNLKIDDIIGKTDYDISPNTLADKYRQDDLEIIWTGKQKITEENINTEKGLGWSETYKSPFFDDKGNVLGTVGLARDITEEKQAECELKFRQEQIVKAAERESLLRKVIETLRSSLDIDQVKKNVIYEIGKAFKADRCYFRSFDKTKDEFLPVDTEYLSSNDIKSLVGVEPVQQGLKCFLEELKQLNKGFCPIVVDGESIKNLPLEFYIKSFGIKADYVIPIIDRKDEIIWLVLHYSKENTELTEDSKKLLETIAYQIETAFAQIKLYEIVKKTAEREKINRILVEILSSTLDKKTIKNLFVKNIGEFFKANRVVFAEFDAEKGIFLPADEMSEYLPNKNEMSFVNYEWTDDSLFDFVQPLKDNKEINIFCWDEYLRENQKSQGFISLFEAAGVKSSYNIPVSHIDKIVGFFCIEFTQEVCRLSDEDIEFLRSISKQAAIALYHSQLYLKAQESARAKGEFIANISHEIKTPLNIIIGFSEILSESQLERDRQLGYLNNIKNSGKHLLDLTNDIIHIAKLESENFKLNYENIDSEGLIREVVSSIILIAAEKNIKIEVDTIKAYIDVDKKMLTQILYNLLNNAIKFTPENGKVIVKSVLNNDKLIVSIEDTGIGISDANQNIVFEKFKQVDSSYSRKHQGVGLGLSITKKLVDLHNGSMHLESIEGKGSRFWFVLPNANKASRKPETNATC